MSHDFLKVRDVILVGFLHVTAACVEEISGSSKFMRAVEVCTIVEVIEDLELKNKIGEAIFPSAVKVWYRL